MDIITRLNFAWNGGETRRYHTHRPINDDTVGHHSYNVAMTIVCLWPDATAALLVAALTHDIAEHKVGDIPAPTKRHMPNIFGQPFRTFFATWEAAHILEAGLPTPTLTKVEEWQLKFADSLDGMRFCLHERQLGNRTPINAEIFGNFAEYVADHLNEAPAFFQQAVDAYEHLLEEWKAAA